jgi:hypothetical protein
LHWQSGAFLNPSTISGIFAGPEGGCDRFSSPILRYSNRLTPF